MSMPTKLITDITLMEALASRKQRESMRTRPSVRKVYFNPVVTIVHLEETAWTYWKSKGLTCRPSPHDSILDFQV